MAVVNVIEVVLFLLDTGSFVLRREDAADDAGCDGVKQ